MNLLKMADLTKQDIMKILNLADQLKYDLKHGVINETLKGKHLGMIFNKASTRTRVSFEVGMSQLGGKALFLSSSELQIGRGEPIQDTARVLSRYLDGIMIRTYSQQEVEDLAKYSTIPIINGLTDYAHPCQVLADLMTIREYKKTLNGLNLCYIGDGNNMCNSIIVGAITCEMNIAVATPKGYEPDKGVIAWAGDKLRLTTDPREAAENADVLFTDVWASMGQEQEQAIRAKAFDKFQINKELMALANKGAIVQHCLPAHRGEEITADVFEEHSEEIFDEAENRLHAQKAVMSLLMGNHE